MKIVGDKLEQLATLENDKVGKDLFGRSAFNRYYYAAFLITRKMLGDIKSSWKETPHSEIPNLLKTTVRKPVIKKLMADAKKGNIDMSRSSALQSKLTLATNDLSNLLEEAYRIRIIADYNPEDCIMIDGTKITLGSYNLKSAQKWPNNAGMYCKNIQMVRKDLGYA